MNPEQPKVLLVDDNEDDIVLLEDMLDDDAPGKYQIQACNRLLDALRHLSDEQFDLILLDLFLPDSQGIGTYTDERLQIFDIPIVVISGLDDEGLALEAVQAGAQDYLIKGEFSEKTLLRAMDYAIERHSLKKQLYALSLTDDLTGLYNRKGFSTLVEQQIKFALRIQGELLFFFIDVDDLKQINDRFGHSAGDRALEVTAEILRNTFRDSDIIGRAGGDEFVVVTVDSKIDDRESILQRLEIERQKIAASSMDPFDLRFSVGVASWTVDDPKTFDALMGEADRNMYRHKRSKLDKLKLGQPDGSVDSVLALDHEDLIIQESGEDDGRQILLVEDNPGDARLIQEYLKEIDHKYEVSHVTRIDEAVEYLENNRVSLVLLDLSLPDSQGLETIGHIIGGVQK